MGSIKLMKHSMYPTPGPYCSIIVRVDKASMETATKRLTAESKISILILCRPIRIRRGPI